MKEIPCYCCGDTTEREVRSIPMCEPCEKGECLKGVRWGEKRNCKAKDKDDE